MERVINISTKLKNLDNHNLRKPPGTLDHLGSRQSFVIESVQK